MSHIFALWPQGAFLLKKKEKTKTIKLNKYNSNNSRLIEKLAAFRVLSKKKKKIHLIRN